VPSLVSLIGNLSRGDDGYLERAIFGAGGAAMTADRICDFVEDQLGPVGDGIFYQRSVGIVAGLRLVGGREIVVKVHRYQVSTARLEAVHKVQIHLADIGLPVPRPLCRPKPLGSGVAVIEELRAGAAADGHDPQVRRAFAAGLLAVVSGARPLGSIADLGSPILLRSPSGPLWPEPHDLRFDFEATRDGAEWIDDLAALARDRLQAAVAMTPVIGHFDWRVGNLGYERGHISAIYDWDSVGMAPEAFVVGAASAQFSADWSTGAALPSPEEMRAFVEEYETARGATFEAVERDVVEAANLVMCAYGARCQHSDMTLGQASVAWCITTNISSPVCHRPRSLSALLVEQITGLAGGVIEAGDRREVAVVPIARSVRR
jgi:hypothetical protein